MWWSLKALESGLGCIAVCARGRTVVDKDVLAGLMDKRHRFGFRCGVFGGMRNWERAGALDVTGELSLVGEKKYMLDAYRVELGLRV